MKIAKLTKKEQSEILKKNKKIEDAVTICQMMEHPGWKIAKKRIEDMKKSIQTVEDIRYINKETINDVIGRVNGISDVLEFFKTREKIANNPRRDPITGEVEVMNKNK